MTDKNKDDNYKPKFNLKLSEVDISVLKAAIEYYLLDDSYGYKIWGIECETYSSIDTHYSKIASDVYTNLNKLSNVKPDFGWWGDIKGLHSVLEKEVHKLEKKAKTFKRRTGWPYSQMISYYSRKDKKNSKKSKSNDERHKTKSKNR